MAVQMRKDLEKAKLKPRQQELLNAFYSARREAPGDDRIPYTTLERICKTVNYETDFAIAVLQSADDKLIELKNDKMRKEMEQTKAKGAKR